MIYLLCHLCIEIIHVSRSLDIQTLAQVHKSLAEQNAKSTKLFNEAITIAQFGHLGRLPSHGCAYIDAVTLLSVQKIISCQRNMACSVHTCMLCVLFYTWQFVSTISTESYNTCTSISLVLLSTVHMHAHVHSNIAYIDAETIFNNTLKCYKITEVRVTAQQSRSRKIGTCTKQTLLSAS